MIPSFATFLILEDQVEICDFIEIALAEKVNKILIAHSLAEAYKIEASEKINFALIDACLPDGDPFLFIKRLMSKDCRILLMSGNFEMNKQFERLPLPHLEKPFRIITLLNQIEKAFNTPSPFTLSTSWAS